MTSTRSVSSLIAFLWLGGLSACAPAVLLATPVSKAGDGWTLTLSQVKEGPDEYVGEVATITPQEGEKFVWTTVTVKNDGSQPQDFAYESCLLEGKGQSRQPVIIDRNTGAEIKSAADPSETFEPGQDRTRQLIYKFAKESHPTRLKCGAVTLPIPVKK